MFRFIIGQLAMALETNCVVKCILKDHHTRKSSSRLFTQDKLVHLNLSIPLNKNLQNQIITYFLLAIL